jgi:hypothetical protein
MISTMKEQKIFMRVSDNLANFKMFLSIWKSIHNYLKQFFSTKIKGEGMKIIFEGLAKIKSLINLQINLQE